jgi:hypothetical protein
MSFAGRPSGPDRQFGFRDPLVALTVRLVGAVRIELRMPLNPRKLLIPRIVRVVQTAQ